MLEFRKVFRLDRRLTAELWTQRKPLIKGLICVGLTSLLAAALIPIVDLAVKAVENRDPRTLAELSAVVIILFAVKYWFTRGQTYYLSKAANLLTKDLRLRIFNKLQKLPISFFNQTRSGLIQSVIDNDVGLFQSAIMIVRDSVDGPIRAVVSFVIVCTIQWQLALVAVVFVPLMARLIQANGVKMKRSQAKVQADFAELQAMTQESIYGVRVVKAFSAEQRITNIYEQLAEHTFDSQMETVRTVASLRPLVELLGGVAVAIVLIICGWLAFHKTVTSLELAVAAIPGLGNVVSGNNYEIAKIAAALYAFDVINSGFRTLGYVNSSINQVQAGADRIYGQVLNQEAEEPDRPGSKELPSPRGHIEFKDVSFTYPDGTVALKHVSFVIEPGTSLALVGSSGAGKSTIADLLLRFYEPTKGKILFDGCDIAELKLGWLRSQIGVVPQQTFLFAGTISENIRLGNENASRAEVEAAAEAAHAHAFVDLMPNRYETNLGEAGVGLSGGERQRIAIARALIRKPTVLLLDEATSSLDAVSEKLVQDALNEIMHQRTTLFIAHRLTSAARADRILMLRHGETVESGSHNQLMRANEAYAAMYRAFSSGVMDESLV